MQNHVWAKTLLSTYRFLERVAGAIDRIIEKKALSPTNCYNYSYDGTLDLTEKIIELSQRKIDLINIKILTENILSKMDPLLANILIKKYIDSSPSQQAVQSLSIPRRTYFRKIVEAEESFESICSMLGYSADKLDKMLENEKWIMSAKRSFEKKCEASQRSSSLNS